MIFTALKDGFGAVLCKKQFFFLIFQKKALTTLIFYGIISLAELRMNQ